MVENTTASPKTPNTAASAQNQQAASPELNTVQPQMAEMSSSGSAMDKSQKIIIGAVVGLLLLVGGVWGFWRYYVANPQRIFQKAWEELETAESVRAAYEVTGEDIFLSMDAALFDDENELNELAFSVNGVEELGNFDMTFLLSAEDTYVWMMAQNINEWESEVDEVLPGYRSVLRTYQLLRPVLHGESWLHIENPESSGSNTGGSSADEELDEEDLEMLQQKFFDAMIVKKIDPFYSYQGSRHTQLVFGFKQDKLAEFVNSFKDLNIEVEVSDINEMVDAIESTDGWDAELVEFVVDSQGRLVYLSANVPANSVEEISESLENREAKGGTMSQIVGGLSSELPGLLGTDQTETVYYNIGELRLSDYNAVAPIQPPPNVVEFEVIMQAAQQELLPLFGAMMMDSGAPGSAPPGANPFIQGAADLQGLFGNMPQEDGP